LYYLACISKKYFESFINDAKAHPLVWTTGLMCPEAYTLHDAITGYVNNETREEIRLRAVMAYDKYQKSGMRFANGLLVSGSKIGRTIRYFCGKHRLNIPAFLPDKYA